MKQFALLIFLFLAVVPAFAQLPDEGTLIYKVDTLRRLEKRPGSHRLTHLSISFKDGGKLTRMQCKYVGDKDQTVLFLDQAMSILFKEPDSSTVILQIPPADFPVRSFYKATQTQQIRDITTLKCRQWIITNNKSGIAFDTWVLEQKDIRLPIGRYFTQFTVIDGLPIEFEMEMSGWLLHVKLLTFENKKLDTKAFETPPGKILTLNDIVQDMKKMN